ncbi:NAD-dependent epimerase/dehydratase family protein [Clostridium estertheticum]|uniref:NAD-dependent epimerase/dehydratase family protein n=1 Tax=Clostridium estertheticum TaxID=238834 RepID=UPI00124DA6B3|nr:NAD-dependent epimerase/dehydratase family protein [Clostridium estertheticum]MBZ9618248.1 NAD-dependent epimerase/dehydratase family protein [Clostridium estertheticum subsp. laramiense]WAG76250.1 NAD-dependent epimerase/dehydratase family protein [Clostridium estertheticum]
MKILVMGGTEFVSSSLVRYLLAKNHTIDIFTRGIRSLKYSGVSNHYKGDRRLINDLERSIKGVKYDYVFDMSAYMLVDVQNLLDTLDKENLKRYIFCSSGSVYQSNNNFITEDFNRGYNENWGDYGLNKLQIEDYLFNLFKNTHFPVVIFRPTYIYGEENNLYRESYIFDRLKNNLDIPIPDSNSRLQFIHIMDLVKVFESAMYNENTIGESYNVVHPDVITWDTLINTAMKITNTRVNIKKVDSTLDIKSREYFPFRDCTYLLDTHKAKNHNLYQPQISLIDGLGRAYKWYCKVHPKLKDDKMKKIEQVLKK